MTINTTIDFANEDVAPREVGSDPSADERTGRHRRSRHTAENPVAQRALLALVGLGGERGDRRNHEDGTETLDERPSYEQLREVLRERRHERPGAVHEQADPERALGAPAVARAYRRSA